jgi:hypothetical protein
MTSTPTATPENSAFCASCGTRLSAGARFCHRCGTAVVGGEAEPGRADTRSMLPWSVAGLALVALLALIAGQFFGGRAAPAVGDAASAPPSAVRAPDISAMTPQERADRLFDRVMQLSSDGKMDSAKFFAPMAMASIEALTPATAHTRYDLGLVALVVGETGTAVAQADTILRDTPKHLLGLVLAARAAGARHDDNARLAFEKRLLAAEPGESARALPEYIDHANDIRSVVDAARKDNK